MAYIVRDLQVEGMDDIIQYLENLEERMPIAFFEAAHVLSEAVEVDAVLTRSYNNDTFATRTSTVAFASAYGQLEVGRVEEAIETANAHRPDSASDEAVPPPPGENEVVIYVLSATNYSKHLNERYGGRSMYLEHAIMDNAVNIAAGYQKVFQRYFRP